MKLIDLASPVGIFILGTITLALGLVFLNLDKLIAGSYDPTAGLQLTQVGVVLIILSPVMWFVMFLLREIRII